MKRVVYHQLAAKELIESVAFYEGRRRLLGEEFLLEINSTIKHIQKSPQSGKVGNSDTFSRKTKRFPFRIVYKLQPDRIWIVAVAHLARRPDYWLTRVS